MCADPDAPRSRHRRKITLALRAVLILAALAAAGWWLLLSPVPVTAHTVASGAIIAEVLGTGTLEARTSAIVGPKHGGLLVEIAADQGDRVTRGALLFRLEDGDIQQQVAMAESEVAAATAGLERLQASRRKAEAVLVQARANYQRVEQLTRQNVSPQADLDRAREAQSVAEAEAALADAAILEGRRQLDAAERAVAYQRALLADATVEAPFDGLVVRRDRDAGDVVAAGASVLQIASTDEMWITAWVDETELARLAEGQPARVAFRSEPEVAYAGVVARVGREADRETREIVVDVRVEQLPERWAIGQRAEVFIEVERKQADATLPPQLLLVRDGATGVLVNESGRARWREIAVGLRGREGVEILRGLAPGDVVVRPADGRAEPLRDGRSIAIR